MPISKLHSTRGFTYLWVLLSVAFMGVAMMLGAESWRVMQQRALEGQLLFIGRQFQQALRSYQSVPNSGGLDAYPLNVQDLIEDRRGLVVRRHLRQLYLDPFTGQADWVEIRVGGRLMGFRSRSQVSAIKQAGFDVDLQHLTGGRTVGEWEFSIRCHVAGCENVLTQ